MQPAMQIRNVRTGKRYNATPDTWDAIKQRGDAHLYEVVTAPPTPKDVQKMKPVRETKTPEFDIHERSDNSSPGEDPGADS